LRALSFPEEPGKRTLSGGEGLDWDALVSRFVHPTKVWIIEAMLWIGRPLSASELEKVFSGKWSISAISYHLTALAKRGIVTKADKERVRGAWKSLYVFAPAVKK